MSGLPLEVRSFDQYPPLRPSTDELHVLHPIRVEACACGGWVRQYPDEHPTVVVHRHNQTPEHREWRLRLAR